MSRAIRDEFARPRASRASKVVLIPHGVDTGRFRPATPGRARSRCGGAWACPPTARIIIYTGRLLRGKGLETLLDGLRGSSAAAVPHAHLVLVGSGAGQSLSVEDDLAPHAPPRAPGGSRVTFAGRVDDVEDWLRASDVFAFPSVFEALGISLVEAAACGLPAVGLAHGRHRRTWWSDGRVGLAGARPATAARWPTALRRAGRPTRDLAARAWGPRARASRGRAVRRARRRRPLSRAVPRGGGEGGRLRIALTGATGYTGGRLLARFRADGHEVAALARADAGARGRAGVRWVEGDLARRGRPAAAGRRAPTPSCTSPRSTARPAIPTRTIAT